MYSSHRTCSVTCLRFNSRATTVCGDNYDGRLSDNYDGRYDCPLGPDVKRGGAPTGDRPQRAAA